MKVQFYNNWSLKAQQTNVFTPCVWYSSDGFEKGIGIDFFGFGIYLQW